jgi:nucleotide-binding universal stress UspA family protein
MRILLATDGSENSEKAAEFLNKLNLSSDDEIIVLHVISKVPFKDDRQSYYESLKKIKEDIGSKILDSTINKLKVNGRISTTLLDGYPDKIIVDAADESKVDLIIMGARGIKGIKSLFLGSTTRSVSINSTIPVLAIKPSPWESKGGIKILYATDGSKYAIETGRLLTAIPFPENTQITILNVISTSFIDIPERYWMEVDDKIKEEIAKIREVEFGTADRIIEEAKSLLSEKFSEITVSIKFGDPSLEILSVSEALKTDIIAVGSSGIRGVKGMLGSVSRSVLGDAKCSVLIGKILE